MDFRDEGERLGFRAGDSLGFAFAFVLFFSILYYVAMLRLHLAGISYALFMAIIICAAIILYGARALAGWLR